MTISRTLPAGSASHPLTPCCACLPMFFISLTRKKRSYLPTERLSCHAPVWYPSGVLTQPDDSHDMSNDNPMTALDTP